MGQSIEDAPRPPNGRKPHRDDVSAQFIHGLWNMMDALRAMSSRVAMIIDEIEPETIPKEKHDTDLRRLARAIHRARSMRAQFFPTRYFSEAGWNIMLDLFDADEMGERVPVSAACVASDCPPSTAMRWINFLHEDGLIDRVADSDDKRRIYLELTAKGREAMVDYLEQCADWDRPTPSSDNPPFRIDP